MSDEIRVPLTAHDPDNVAPEGGIIIDEKTGEEVGTTDSFGTFTPKAKHSLELNNAKLDEDEDGEHEGRERGEHDDDDDDFEEH